MKLLKPKNVLEVATYVHQIDAKLTCLKVKAKPPYLQSNFGSPLQNLNTTMVGDNRPRPCNIRHLTPEEINHCRKNGLGFHCKDKFVKGHTCERKQLILIDVQDSELDDTENIEIEELEITTCALFGTSAPPTIQTMKVSGYIKSCPVTILIDSGSSHNFVDVELVKRLKEVLDKGYVFNVKIADGGKVPTHGTFARVPITIHEFNCISDL